MKIRKEIVLLCALTPTVITFYLLDKYKEILSVITNYTIIAFAFIMVLFTFFIIINEIILKQET